MVGFVFNLVDIECNGAWFNEMEANEMQLINDELPFIIISTIIVQRHEGWKQRLPISFHGCLCQNH